LVDQAAEDDGTSTHVQAAAVLRAAGVVNAEDLKRFASYFWNEGGSDLVEKDEATRCLRAFLQVGNLRPLCVAHERVVFLMFPLQDQLENETTDTKKVLTQPLPKTQHHSS
jgi:hypothetical protein